MKLTVDEKIFITINMLLSNQYADIMTIANKLKISKRNAYYTIDEINKLLVGGKQEILISVYNKGFHLDSNQTIFLSSYVNKIELNNTSILSEKERISFIYCYVLTSKEIARIKTFENILKISKFTINNDINKLRQLLQDFKIELVTDNNGYEIRGNELAQRQAFLYFFSVLYELIIDGNFNYETEIYNNSVKMFYESIKSLDASVNKYFDSSLLALSSLLNYVYNKKKYIENVNVLDSNDLDLIHSIEFAYMKQVHINLPKSEQLYFSLYLFCSRINIDFSLSEDYLNKIITAIFDITFSLTGVMIDDNELKNNLKHHLGLTFLRIKYGIAINNPLINEIKESYSTYFELVKRIVSVLENEFQTVISDNEIGFIALYFIAYFKNIKTIKPKKKIIIICLNGTSTSFLLKNEIESLDSDLEVIACYGLNEYLENDIDCDLVISTVKTNAKKNNKLLVVNPILTGEDKVNILSFVNENSSNNYLSYLKVVNTIKPYIKDNMENVKHDLRDLYTKKDIITNNDGIFKINFVDIIYGDEYDWKQLIKLASTPLVLNGYIKDDYAQSIIDIIEEYGSYMVCPNYYLLGHASVNKTMKLGLSFVLLKNPVVIMGNKVEKIIIISPVNSHSHLGIINRLLDLFKDEKFNQKVNETNNKIELFNLINNYIFIEAM